MSHFSTNHTKFTGMLDDVLFKSLLMAPVPPACTTWCTLLAAEFQNLYGPEVATALRTPPVISASLVIDSAARMQASEAMSLPSCIHQFAPCYCTLYNRLSHRKMCNALANYVQQCALSLYHAGASVLGDVYLAHFLFSSFDSLSDKDVIHQIITHEFGVLVTERLSQEIPSQSVKLRTARLNQKQNEVAGINNVHAEQEREWPMPVSKEVIFECLNGYMKGMMCRRTDKASSSLEFLEDVYGAGPIHLFGAVGFALSRSSGPEDFGDATLEPAGYWK
ncbi:hypothetical protein EV702DRAFT_1086513 [Suillus placidus]|uniref:Uncharacterized protein n=1 Tax=Suillus placidus TaxID=48579 RepID=A0A9P6ZZP3_9AGAM|nr:hypothetical protein EV702DRAFT_1086513 [Suillus placidus]